MLCLQQPVTGLSLLYVYIQKHTAFGIHLIRVYKSWFVDVLIACLHKYILYVCRSGRLYLKIIVSLTERISRNVILLDNGIFKKKSNETPT